MRLGIIGAGSIVQEFLPGFMELKGLEVVAIQNHNKEKAAALADRYGISVATDNFEVLCASGIDTVYVALPNALHFACCKDALERGLHVIVEKPMTTNHREAEILADLAREKGLFLFEAVPTRYQTGYEKLQALLPRIGAVKLVQSQYTQYSRRYDAFRAGQVLPVFDPQQAGGALMDLGFYNVTYVTGLFGSPERFQYHPNVERGIDTSGVLTMQYPGFQAVCVAGKDCKGNAFGLIQGTDGSIKSDCPPSIVGKVTLVLNDGTVEEYPDEAGRGDRMKREFRAFIRAIQEKDHGFCDEQLEKSLAVSRVMTKARLEAGVRFPGDDRMGL